MLPPHPPSLRSKVFFRSWRWCILLLHLAFKPCRIFNEFSERFFDRFLNKAMKSQNLASFTLGSVAAGMDSAESKAPAVASCSACGSNICTRHQEIKSIWAKWTWAMSIHFSWSRREVVLVSDPVKFFLIFAGAARNCGFLASWGWWDDGHLCKCNCTRKREGKISEV